MTSSSGGSRHGPPPRAAADFRRHELELADGGRLVLDTDGSIVRTDALGTRTHAWTPDDPEWPDQAIRFGLHPQASTVAPQHRGDQGTKPAR